jgi:SAM-dependent methyltransferase
MINQKNYTYPDTNDSLTIQMIGEIEAKAGINWGGEEEVVLDILRQLIQKNVKNNDSLLIDFGCGEGRLLTDFGGFFDKLIAVEPDKIRLENAIKLTKKSNIFSKTTFINEMIETAKISEPADTTLISHVIQHIDPNSVKKVLKKAHSSLKDGGLLYLATNNMAGSRDKFTKSYLNNGKLKEVRINREEFKLLVRNNKGILPIHWFSQSKLIDLLNKIGFEILFSQTFHGSKNSPERDIAIIARKN